MEHLRNDALQTRDPPRLRMRPPALSLEHLDSYFAQSQNLCGTVSAVKTFERRYFALGLLAPPGRNKMHRPGVTPVIGARQRRLGSPEFHWTSCPGVAPVHVVGACSRFSWSPPQRAGRVGGFHRAPLTGVAPVSQRWPRAHDRGSIDRINHTLSPVVFQARLCFWVNTNLSGSYPAASTSSDVGPGPWISTHAVIHPVHKF